MDYVKEIKLRVTTIKNQKKETQMKPIRKQHFD